MKTLLTGLPALLLACGAALAQPPGSTPAAAPAPASPPTTPAPATTDAEILAVLRPLTGSFKAAPQGDQPGLLMNTAAISVEGLDNALYFEIGRADSPADPFRHGVMHVYKRQGELRLRVLDFDLRGVEPGFAGAVTGLWAAPDVFPVLKLDQLAVNTEMVLKGSGGTYTGRTEHPMPVILNGATEMASAVEITSAGVRFTDRGFDAAGKQVWGPTSAGPLFAPAPPPAAVERREGGLVVIDLVSAPADRPVAGEGTTLAVQYSGWLTSGLQFDSSRQPGREPFPVTLPAQLIAGWNQGLPGAAVGTRRRLVIPGPLGYGERGNPRARIPGNATLIFEIEPVYLKEAEAKPAPEGAGQGEGGGGMGPR